ncbi:hypothetical protein [Thiohalorhabdus sp.]|uniref:hypothetical protein n=1 Tax=Thiohalorhabdus sp. TaxID=3094134 RepID=UPI002FC3A8E0
MTADDNPGELAPFQRRTHRVNIEDREADIRITAGLPGIAKTMGRCRCPTTP